MVGGPSSRPLVVTAHQPVYLPWLGLLHKLALADVFVEFDDVLYDDRDFQNRNRIRGPNGPIWLSVPILARRSSGRDDRERLKVKDAVIRNDLPWRRKHHKSITMAYGKAPFARRYLPFFDDLYSREWVHLVDLNRCVLDFLLRELDIQVERERLSDIGLDSRKSQLVLDMCIQLGADLFVFGASGRDYADQESFRRRGIQIEFQDYRHPEYPQVYEPFESHLSAIDLLFNCGPRSREVLLTGNLDRSELQARYFTTR